MEPSVNAGMCYYAPIEPAAPVKAAPPPPEVRAVRNRIAAAAQPAAWDELDLSVRMVLISLAVEPRAGDPPMERLVRQAWGSFAPADRVAMASTARLLQRSLGRMAKLACA